MDSREGTPDGSAMDVEGSSGSQYWARAPSTGSIIGAGPRAKSNSMFIRDELYLRPDHGGAVRDHRAIGLDRAAKDGPAFGGVDLPGRGWRTRAKRDSF